MAAGKVILSKPLTPKWNCRECHRHFEQQVLGNRVIDRRHQRVLIDICIWIYHFESNPVFGQAADSVIEQLEAGRFRGIASELTLLELIVKPLQLGRQDAADDYESLLSYFPNLDLVPISRAILLEAAALRARYRLRSPDAVQLATAFASDATLAVTNDEAWKDISGIETVLLSDTMTPSGNPGS